MGDEVKYIELVDGRKISFGAIERMTNAIEPISYESIQKLRLWASVDQRERERVRKYFE